MTRIPDPFSWLGEAGQWRLFLLVLFLSVVALVALNEQGKRLVTAESPQGIVTFELVGTADGAARILASWGPEGRVVAGLNLGFDYLFMLVYAVGLSLGASIAARQQGRFSEVRKQFGLCLAWAGLLAGLLDAVENYALIKILFGAGGEFWPTLSRGCARPKFAIVGVVLTYVISTPIITRMLARAR